MRVKILDHVNDFTLLEKEVNDLIETIGFEKNQIMCQTHRDNCQDWYTGIGRIEELEEKEEKKYKFINPLIKNTEIGRLIEKYQGFRSRIMIMNPKSCYSIHQDPTPRIHIPITTDSLQSWMIWPLDNECHRMPLGMVYWTDTTKKHTFINCSEKIRIHLIMGVDSYQVEPETT
jgi:hypothetical protein